MWTFKLTPLFSWSVHRQTQNNCLFDTRRFRVKSHHHLHTRMVWRGKHLHDSPNHKRLLCKFTSFKQSLYTTEDSSFTLNYFVTMNVMRMSVIFARNSKSNKISKKSLFVAKKSILAKCIISSFQTFYTCLYSISYQLIKNVQ